MARRFSRMRCSFVLLAASILLLLKGCSMGPPEFETYELDFRDTLQLQAPGQEVFIVLEQLPDGPVSRYEEVTYEVTASNLFADSLILTLDVIGLASEPTPTVFKETRLEADTLYVWYADHPRTDTVEPSNKNSAGEGMLTTPPESYLKVRHVTIELHSEIDVGFTSRFIW